MVNYMLQAVMEKPGEIAYREISKPATGKNEVLIKIKEIGICGSDIHVFHGTHPYTSYPIVQGHEVSGIVEEIGGSVSDFKIGDKVILMPQVVCGECYPCRNNLYHICDSLKVMGFQTDGTAQEYIAIDENMLLKIPKNISFKEGAMIEPVAVAVHAVTRGDKLFNKKVIVLGAGTIGNLVGQVSKGLGASMVMITDISDFRLKIAKECGLDFAINSKTENLNNSILKNFGKDKADIIFECVGCEETISQAISGARKGSKIIVVGVFGEKPCVDIGLVQDRELSLIGTLMYQKTDFLKAIELVEKGKLHLKKLISDEFPFLKYLEAYKYIIEKKDKVMKVMVSLIDNYKES